MAFHGTSMALPWHTAQPCDQFFQSYDQLVHLLADTKIQVVEVNGDKDRSLMDKYEITDVPTLVYFKGLEEHIIYNSTRRDLGRIVTWLEDPTQPLESEEKKEEEKKEEKSAPVAAKPDKQEL